MKKMIQLQIAVLALIACTFSTLADGIGATPVVMSPGTLLNLIATNVIPASTTITNRQLIDCSHGKELALEFRCNSTTTNSFATFLTFEYSLDQAYWTNAFTWNPVSNGTNIVVAITNVTVAGIPYVRLTTTWNSNALAVLTNVYLNAYSK